MTRLADIRNDLLPENFVKSLELGENIRQRGTDYTVVGKSLCETDDGHHSVDYTLREVGGSPLDDRKICGDVLAERYAEDVYDNAPYDYDSGESRVPDRFEIQVEHERIPAPLIPDVAAVLCVEYDELSNRDRSQIQHAARTALDANSSTEGRVIDDRGR